MFPAPHRSGAIAAAGVAAWPVLAATVVNSAGVGGCVRSHGIVGFIATHGAMMREVPSCPSTHVGMPAVIDSRLSVILAAAIAVTLLQGFIAVIGTRAAEWVHRLAEALWGIIAPTLVAVKRIVNFRLAAHARTLIFGSAAGVHVPWRRGPPAWGYAAA